MIARHALAEDVPTLEVSLARAFADDPMITWVAGSSGPDDRDRRIETSAVGFFRPSLAAGFVRGHTYTVPGRGGAAIWSAPDVRMFTELEGADFGAAIVQHFGPTAMERLMALSEMVSSHHPHESHFYLFLLGAAEQGQGIGAALMRPVLERCDADRLPAYLEASSERNMSFYERHGFRVLWADRPTDDGPLLRGMWRDPA